jgi:hypothetical protein
MAAVRRVTAASHDHFNATAFVEATLAPDGNLERATGIPCWSGR